MITLTAEAAQQIEEALVATLKNNDYWLEKCTGALDTIRAARAQEQAEQEPVAIHQWRKKIPADQPWHDDEYKFAYARVDDFYEARTVYAAPMQQAEQEPVAVVVSEHTHSEYASIKYLADRRLPCKTKLYAAPVRTKDLTDDGISDAIHGKGSPLRLHDYAIRDFRAVIAADRDLNK